MRSRRDCNLPIRLTNLFSCRSLLQMIPFCKRRRRFLCPRGVRGESDVPRGASMSSKNVLSQLAFTKRVAKRAQYEALEFSLTTRGVRVRNTSHPNPSDHEYRVTIRNGIPIACECPADARYEGACKHRVGVAIRTPLLQAATNHFLVADGGTQIEKEAETHVEDSDSDQPEDCDCDGLGGFPCWPCVRSGRRDLPEE
ncbi:SWIM zinc finger family protein (plasmid) [Haladaptatus sp. SPP-AMP-3]|uniref:SWIM zinc finger family protein n=1 Tax=Haladaptatus sp. SPP-AMP-3 TaxID=3121295 RepID=UPI003C2DBFB2